MNQGSHNTARMQPGEKMAWVPVDFRETRPNTTRVWLSHRCSCGKEDSYSGAGVWLCDTALA